MLVIKDLAKRNEMQRSEMAAIIGGLTRFRAERWEPFTFYRVLLDDIK